jgi:hypothetical protein
MKYASALPSLAPRLRPFFNLPRAHFVGLGAAVWLPALVDRLWVVLNVFWGGWGLPTGVGRG